MANGLWLFRATTCIPALLGGYPAKVDITLEWSWCHLLLVEESTWICSHGPTSSAHLQYHHCVLGIFWKKEASGLNLMPIVQTRHWNWCGWTAPPHLFTTEAQHFCFIEVISPLSNDDPYGHRNCCIPPPSTLGSQIPCAHTNHPLKWNRKCLHLPSHLNKKQKTTGSLTPNSVPYVFI